MKTVIEMALKKIADALPAYIDGVASREYLAIIHKALAEQPAQQEPADATQRKPLTDEQIQDVATKAVREHKLSWLGFKKDNQGVYNIPVLSPADYKFARAIEAAHGIKE